MMLSDVAADPDTVERYIAWALQSLLAALLVVGLVTRQLDLIMTGGITLGVTLLPALLKQRFDYVLHPGLLAWLALSASIHAAGSLGLYEQFQWFDNIAHTVSAMVIAGIGYAAFRALELYSPDIDVPGEFRFVFIIVFALATGVFWEILEFALGDLITVYGINDIVTDMIFNTLGAVIVAVLGTGSVDGLTGFFRERLRAS